MIQFKLDNWKDSRKRDVFINHIESVMCDDNHINFVSAGDCVLVECELQELGEVFYPSFRDWVNNTNPVIIYPDDCDYITELSGWDREELENKRVIKWGVKL